jgi:DNA-entry nuclease
VQQKYDNNYEVAWLKKIRIYVIVMGLIAILCGCSESVTDGNTYPIENGSQIEISSEEVTEISDQTIEIETEKIPEYNPAISKEDDGIDTDKTYFLENIPDYSGAAYVVLNNNIPEFSEEDKTITEPFEYYSDWDNLGRCGQAYANICEEIEPTEERGSIGAVKPSGWHTVKYNDLIDGNYLYNRCHLIGYQLAGENANEKNLITGTRYLNVVGMLEFENLVDDYVDSTGNHVLYRVTPIFEGDNLVASGVQMEGWSVEDNGAGICFNVYCYNVQPGIEIDYATGDSWIAEEQTSINETASAEEASSDTDNTDNTDDTDDTETMNFIINTNTKKFHLTTCSSVDDMAEHNKKEYSGTVEELVEQGYSPCKRCLAGY